MSNKRPAIRIPSSAIREFEQVERMDWSEGLMLDDLLEWINTVAARFRPEEIGADSRASVEFSPRTIPMSTVFATNSTRATIRQLRADVAAICFPRGRMVGSPGHRKAHKVLCARLDDVGCVPYRGDSFKSVFPLAANEHKSCRKPPPRQACHAG